MAITIDPIDLLCRGSNHPNPLHEQHAPHLPGLFPASPYAHQHHAVHPLLSLVSSPHAASALAGPPGLSGPPGLDSLGHGALLPEAPPIAAPIHAWALEAKIKAEQAQAKQQEWAEKMQLQYTQGQNILKVLRASPDQERPQEATCQEVTSQEASSSEGAFDRLVKQMGLTSETPRSAGQSHMVIGQVTPSKHKKPEHDTPAKAFHPRNGEKEDSPSPSASRGGKYESPTHGRRYRGGRRAQGPPYYQ